MEILLVNHKRSTDINEFSGTSFFMSQAIKSEFSQIVELDLLESPKVILNVLKGNFEKALKPYGDRVTKFVQSLTKPPDFIVCQGGNISVPYYNHQVPILYWHDSTWCTFLQYYKTRKAFNQFKADYKTLYQWDKMALERADLVVFSSEFVADSCIKNYRISSNKIFTIPFGANINHLPDRSELDRAIIEKSKNDCINLTFIGIDWERKGLLDAFSLVTLLNHKGVRSYLNVIGSNVEIDGLHNSPLVRNLGFINKADAKDMELLRQTLLKTHYLVHPAIAEPFGIVLCEANAFSIPVLGTNVEGLNTIIKSGINGYLFNKRDFVKLAFKTIVDLHSKDNPQYQSLAKNAYYEYKANLNWESNARKLKYMLSQWQLIKIGRNA